jgi:drug/metabolite transporter (DMT)-like permease
MTPSDRPIPARPNAAPTTIPLGWYLVALAAHTGWGIYPALGRYMQTVSHLPSMSVLVLGGLPMTVALFVFILPRYGTKIYRSRTLWIFAAAVVLRSITNILSQKYTLAIYVQLVALLTPFLVVLFNRLLLKERAPRFTGPAIVLSFIGALLMLSQSLGTDGVTLALTGSDWLGLGLAFASSSFLAIYMILVRMTAHEDVPGDAVLVFQTVMIQISALTVSLLIREDWSVWLHLGGQDWGVFLAYALLVVLGANGLQISAIRRLGAPMVSSLMGWRLISTLLAGMFLLGEQLTSLWQLAGMVLVLVTVTCYLWIQRTPTTMASE